MSVPCPCCGREYDITLFAFGRTIDCACGARVADEPRRIPDRAGHRFIVDAMLGSLARWLRIAGFDAAYEAHVPDAVLVRRALEQDRTLLTRDRRLPSEWTVPRVYLVEAEQTLEQLAEVVRELDLAPAVRPLRRCSLCNARLVVASDEAIMVRVPRRVRRTESRFLACPICERVYWHGTHTERIRETLRRTLGRSPPV